MVVCADWAAVCHFPLLEVSDEAAGHQHEQEDRMTKSKSDNCVKFIFYKVFHSFLSHYCIAFQILVLLITLIRLCIKINNSLFICWDTNYRLLFPNIDGCCVIVLG